MNEKVEVLPLNSEVFQVVQNIINRIEQTQEEADEQYIIVGLEWAKEIVWEEWDNYTKEHTITAEMD